MIDTVKGINIIVILFLRKVAVSSTCLSLMIFNSSEMYNKIRPITLPGKGKGIYVEINSPVNVNHDDKLYDILHR